jgi:hypothetical protein
VRQPLVVSAAACTGVVRELGDSIGLSVAVEIDLHQFHAVHPALELRFKRRSSEGRRQAPSSKREGAHQPPPVTDPARHFGRKMLAQS